MTTCPSCDRDANKMELTLKIATSIAFELWGIASWLLIFLSVPLRTIHQSDRLTDWLINFKIWLTSVWDLPTIRTGIITGAIVGFLIYSWDGIQTIRASKYQHRCKTCGYLWNDN